MSVFTDISAALNTHLKNMTSVPPVAYENKEYSPTLGNLYVRPTVLFGDTTQATLGTAGEDLNIGVYQIDVFAKSGNGVNTAIASADLIANRFKRGTTLTYNSRTVTVVSAQRRAGIQNDGWYQIPVEIIYRSFTQART
jgi:hypothetical protein